MLLYVCLALVLALGLFYVRRPWLGWTLPLALLHFGWWRTGILFPVFAVSAGVFGLVALVTGVRPLRIALVTRRILPLLEPILPRMSETERIAIEAGTVWWEAQFFTGAPDWRRLLGFQPQPLSARERAFLAGPCERVCAMVNDWEVKKQGDLPPEEGLRECEPDRGIGHRTGRVDPR